MACERCPLLTHFAMMRLPPCRETKYVDNKITTHIAEPIPRALLVLIFIVDTKLAEYTRESLAHVLEINCTGTKFSFKIISCGPMGMN